MSREIARRLAALERGRWDGGVRYTVSDRPPEDDDDREFPADGSDTSPPMSEAEWVARYCAEDASLL